MTDNTSLRATIEREFYREQARTMAGEIVELQAERRGHAAERQSLTAERDALAAQLAEVRAELDRAPKVCAIHGVSLAVKADAFNRIDTERADAVSELARVCRDLASERAHLAACRTRIAGLEQAADERSAEVARMTADYMTVVDAIMPRSDGPAHAAATARSHRRHIDELEAEVARMTARVAELEARPVLTVERLTSAVYLSRGIPMDIAAEAAKAIIAALGPVTLPPAQDRAEELCRAYHERAADMDGHMVGRWQYHGPESQAICTEAMRHALASLGAPPTSPTAARPVFAGVSMDEALRDYDAAFDACKCEEDAESCCRLAGIRAVLARLEVSLVAPVDPEAVAIRVINDMAARRSDQASWTGSTIGYQAAVTDAMRATLLAAGIPVKET